MAEKLELSNEELNAALTNLFERVDEMGLTLDDLKNSLGSVESRAETAIAIAKEAKRAVGEIKIVPTNRFDVINNIVDDTSSVIKYIAWGCVVLGGLYIFFGPTIQWTKTCTKAQEKKPEEPKIKVE